MEGNGTGGTPPDPLGDLIALADVDRFGVANAQGEPPRVGFSAQTMRDPEDGTIGSRFGVWLSKGDPDDPEAGTTTSTFMDIAMLEQTIALLKRARRSVRKHGG